MVPRGQLPLVAEDGLSLRDSSMVPSAPSAAEMHGWRAHGPPQVVKAQPKWFSDGGVDEDGFINLEKCTDISGKWLLFLVDIVLFNSIWLATS